MTALAVGYFSEKAQQGKSKCKLKESLCFGALVVEGDQFLLFASFSNSVESSYLLRWTMRECRRPC
jgi:hypothetical protein